jgi:hypothetical protein
MDLNSVPAGTNDRFFIFNVILAAVIAIVPLSNKKILTPEVLQPLRLGSWIRFPELVRPLAVNWLRGTPTDFKDENHD